MRVFIRRESCAQEVIQRVALPDETFAVLVALAGKLQKKRAALFCFSLGEQSFPDHCFDGAVNDGAIKSKQGGDLILIQGGAAAKGGQYEAARLRALRFLFEIFPDREVSSGEIQENGVIQQFLRNQFSVDGDVWCAHRVSTVASIGLRHCGTSLLRGDFFPMAMTMTMS